MAVLTSLLQRDKAMVELDSFVDLKERHILNDARES